MGIKFIQLFQIANKNGTDKGHKGPSKKWSANNYTDIYQAYFGYEREAVKNFCEIGLGVHGPNWESSIAHGENLSGGGSTRMWQEFFPNAKIHGLDINSASHLDNEQVITYQVDQSSEESLKKFKLKTKPISFDIIIDDGSHIADHQQLTLSLLWEKLSPGGFYIIEDLNELRVGETRHTKHAPVNCEPTRHIFQEFLTTGKIDPRNNFNSQDFVQEIAYLALHSFPVAQNFTDIMREIIRIIVGRGGKGLLRHEFCTNAPKLVVLRKKNNK